jgi:hypothetical protein
MDENLEDLKAGEIRFRDKWQFELKTEVFPFSHLKDNIQTQEFYFFIPNSLQINDQTYTKNQFYLDQTNMIRFKTPVFTFKELNDPDNAESPLVRIILLCDYTQSAENGKAIDDEIKLLGNIFHSTLRTRLDKLNQSFKLKDAEFSLQFDEFFQEILNLRTRFSNVQKSCQSLWPSISLQNEFSYVEEFISLTLDDYLLPFLNRLRTKKPQLLEIDAKLCTFLVMEDKERKEKIPALENSQTLGDDEFVLYRKGLLNKFILDPLLLKTSRSSVDVRFKGIILGLPAFFAMLVYSLLFFWQGNVFLFNSEPFILLSVIIYVLKDRLKEELRILSYRQAAKWFSDYTTKILAPADEASLGNMHESFAFVDEGKIPQEIRDIRNREFHNVLEAIKRPEQIIYYKKTINITKKPTKIEARFYGFSIIFRFDIHHFLAKAEDPYQTYFHLNPESNLLEKIRLPRVYHLNIIMKTTTTVPEGPPLVELKKFRLVVDKKGLKRVEQAGH